MTKGSVSVANLPHYDLQTIAYHAQNSEIQNFMNRMAFKWSEYKNSMTVQGLMMGFFGVPPAKGDDIALAAKFFIDAKEAY